ncbi:MAG: hypothetical protein U0229_24555 [Anaeromyxobacter sp.]
MTGAAPGAAEPASTVHAETARFVTLGAGIILAAHAVEVTHAGRANWPALGLRVVWVAVLLVVAPMLQLSGLLPVCAGCRRVRSDAGYWQQIESYVSAHTDATFTHGLCEDCLHRHYPDEAR